MNDQNNLDPNQNERPDAAQETMPEERVQENPYQPPQWYAVSYQGGSNVPYAYAAPVQESGKNRFRKTGLVAVLVAVCLIFSAFAGAGAYMLLNRNDLGGSSDFPVNSNTPNGEVLNGLGGNADAPTYGYTDVAYDYGTAFTQLVKNDGSALVGSPNGSAGATPQTMIQAIAAVKDSVVEITTTVISNRGTMTAGAGSGVIIHKDGVIVTNNHVIADCDKIYVRLTNGDTYEAALRGTDEEGDIAILKITPQADKPLTVAKLGSSKSLVLGEEVFAIGNPLGELGGTVTNGIISSTAREVNVDGVEMTLLQTNAAINSGNSGGGLFNLAGELIGVVNAKYSASGVEGLGFAIPIDSAYERSIKDLMQAGYIRGIPALGVTLVEKTGTTGGYPFGSTIYGAYVYDAGGVAGFQTGDYIYSIDGTVVYGISTSALSAVKSIVRSHKVGDVLTVVLKRGDQNVTVTVTLKEYVPSGIGA